MKKLFSRLLAIGIILTLVGAIIFALGFGLSGFSFKKMSSITTVDHSFTESADAPIDTVEIIFDMCDIDIIFDENATEISASYQTLEARNGKTLTSIDLSVEAGKLKMEEKEDYKTFLFPYTTNAKTVLTIPASREIALDVWVETGDVKTNGSTTLKSLTFRSVTGNVDMRGATIKSLSGISVETGTGDIRFGEFTADSLSLQGTTANVYIQDGTLTNEARIQLSTGDITVLGTLACPKIKTTTSTGDVCIKGVVNAATLSMKTSSGEVETDDGLIDAQSITVNTSSGDVELTLKGSISEYNIAVDKSTGNSNVKNQIGSPRSLNIKVSTGDIEIDFQK